MKRNYHVKFLNEKDVELAEAVCAASEDYYLMEQDKPASKSDALKIITEIPNGKTRFDKFVLAVLEAKVFREERERVFDIFLLVDNQFALS